MLSVLALLLAGYTFLSDAHRLDFRLRMAWYEKYFLIILMVVELGIVFSPVIQKYIESELLFDWHFGFDEATTFFACNITILFYCWCKLRGEKIADSKVKLWVTESERLLREKKFSDLGYLFSKYHNQLFAMIKTGPWYVRLKNKIAVGNRLALNHPPVTPSRIQSFIIKLRNFIARIIPVSSKTEMVSESIAKMLTSKSFVLYLADVHPLVAAQATQMRFRDDDVFVATFFKALISDPESQLYRELRFNQNCSYTGRYAIEDKNILLSFYFKDIKVASEVSIYKPIGDYVVDFIKRQRGVSNYYNLPCDDFSQSDDRYSCPIFAGGMFFEIMIPEVIYQEYDDHMWLMYSQYFIKEILSSLERSPDADVDSEFPTKFDYLLYAIFNACDHWVRAVDHLTAEQVSASVAIKYAVENLGSILRLMLASDKATDRQKRLYLESVIKTMIVLYDKNFSSLGDIILDFSLRRFQGDRTDQAALEAFKRHILGIDHVVRLRASAIEDKLLSY